MFLLLFLISWNRHYLVELLFIGSEFPKLEIKD